MSDRQLLDDRKKQEIRNLSDDFPRIWNNPKTSHRERKRLIRLIIEDVTLVKEQEVSVQIRFKSGATKSLTLPRQKTAWQLHQTPRQVVEEIDRLLDQYTDGQISEKLNAQGLRSGKGEHFNPRMVAKVRRHYNLKSRYDRLREMGLLTQHEIAQELGITEQSVKIWRNDGRLRGRVYNDKKQCLYELIVKSSPDKYQRQNSAKVPPFNKPFQ